MSHSTDVVDTAVAAESASNPEGLRPLYFARFGFAIVWAALLALTAADLNVLSVALLVLYPLVDVGAAVVDARTSGATRSRAPLYLTMAVSLLAAIGLAVAASSGIPSVLRVWGAWAVGAGIVQLVVALQRRRLRGQRALVISGGISVVAGAGFILMAAGTEPTLVSLAGYATLGGIFFLVSALRLGSVEVGPLRARG